MPAGLGHGLLMLADPPEVRVPPGLLLLLEKLGVLLGLPVLVSLRDHSSVWLIKVTDTLMGIKVV